jgi:hypothetical protein
MTSEQDQARLIAERIARRVSEGRDNDAASSQPRSVDNVAAELSAMRAGLDDLRQKLVQIESRLTHDESHDTQAALGGVQRDSERRTATATTSSTASSYGNPALRLSGMYVPTPHPSEERFGVEEATVAELVDYFEGAKKCDLEPGGKPCDHCAMCSSRGF